ncbi:MAG: alcohol dehydrogenase catalytic domain-containing protein [Akkermansiaceae bacterium]
MPTTSLDASVMSELTSPSLSTQRMLFQGAGNGHICSQDDSGISLAAGEVLVRLTMATICGSDLHTYEGRRDCPTPAVLGHEGVGVVETVGEGADTALIGKRVTWTLTDTCGCCKPCTDWNMPQKCDALFKYGHSSLDEGSGYNGCFASHIILRKGTHLVVLPDTMPDSLAVPANCALATMVAVIEPMLKTSNKLEKIMIQGAGLLGVYGAALLNYHGYHDVWLTDIVQDRLDLAAEFGAQTIHSSELNSLETGSFDAVIEVAGVSQIISDGIRLLRPGGVYLWAGMVHDQTPLDILGVEIVKGCLTIIGIHNYRAEHLDESIRFLDETSTDFPWEKLVSPPMKLSDLDAAFALTLERKWHRVSLVPVPTV